MGQIIELPDIQKLKSEIIGLKKHLEDLVLERDELRFVVCENIKMEYMLEIGSLEYRVYKAYCEFQRLRRKKEMIQAKKNRQETVVMWAIDQQLDEEFLAYKQKLDEQINQMNEPLERSQKATLSTEETVEFKKLYRHIVKSLHPDLNPETTEAEQQLFVNATEAYKHGDLAGLQLISQMVGEGEAEPETASSLTKLQQEKQNYQDLVNRVQEEIETIKSQPPYTWKAYIEDAELRTAKIGALNKELQSFQDAIRTQEEYIHDLMGAEA